MSIFKALKRVWNRRRAQKIVIQTIVDEDFEEAIYEAFRRVGVIITHQSNFNADIESINDLYLTAFGKIVESDGSEDSIRDTIECLEFDAKVLQFHANPELSLDLDIMFKSSE